MSRGLSELAVSNYALPANMAYASSESGDTSSVVMANYAINSMPILDSSFTPATIRDHEIHRSGDPCLCLQDYPSFSTSNASYGKTGPWSGNPKVAYYPRPPDETPHQYGAPHPIVFGPHAVPDCLGGPSLEREPRMFRILENLQISSKVFFSMKVNSNDDLKHPIIDGQGPGSTRKP